MRIKPPPAGGRQEIGEFSRLPLPIDPFPA